MSTSQTQAQERSDSRPRRAPAGHDRGSGTGESRRVHAALLVVLCASVFFVRAPWAGFHAVLLGVAGLLVLLHPPRLTPPKSWRLSGGVFVLAGCAALLPSAWFGVPDWRATLQSLGVATGSQVAIQWRQALETHILFALILLTGLWLAGHRASPATLRRCALGFTLCVAAYAVVARVLQDDPAGTGGVFGFFPNRNHSATYLSLGTLCGLGCALQAARDRRFATLAPALAATALCLWAIGSWSISRAGVVLTAFGGLLWVTILGPRYLGRHGLWAIALFALAAAGMFLIAETEVRQRLSDTIGKAVTVIADPITNAAGEESPPDPGEMLDFRIPVFQDTAGMIARHPWTGIGAGQFLHVFPQYQNRSIVAQHAYAHHPESDWLWMASESGIPATLALLALVIHAFRHSLKGILAGRDRALRSACLVAACLVAVHGLFDVPGHRISLAWCAAFLYSLSLHPPSGAARVPSPWPSRILAAALFAASAVLAGSQWFGGPPPAITAAATAITDVRQLYSEDKALQDIAAEQGREHQPDPTDDLLEKALARIDKTKPLAPIDRNLLRYEAFLALHFDDKTDRVDRAFATDLALNPHRIDIPLRQAEAWAPTNPEKAARLIREALRRAGNVEKADPENQANSTRTRERIRQISRKYPDLEAILEQRQ